MHNSLRRAALVLVVGTALLSWGGCKQGEGERCQLDSDCEDGLRCLILSGNTEGTCQSVGQKDAGTDATVDGGKVDKGPAGDLDKTDKGPAPDTGKKDGATQPDKTVTQPDKAVMQPDKTVTQPDQTVMQPDQTVTQPDQAVTPDQTVTLPDQAASQG